MQSRTSSAGGAYLLTATGEKIGFDIVFPVMHGPLCEDGSIQGLLELADLPYVGCGVLSSSVGMDKDVAKRLARDAGLPIVPYVCLRTGISGPALDRERERIARELGFPVFVKPSNMGSSVGVHKVRTAAELEPALKGAFRFDTKVLVEKSVNAREVELSVLDGANPGDAPRVSVPGEIAPTHEFYSYEAKYIDDQGAKLMIPSPLTPEQTKEAQQLARDVFVALDCEGMTRVDLFLDRDTGRFYFNEVNTIPGFTSISMYPKMWEASGLEYSALLTELVNLAVSRHARRRALVREFHAK